LSKANKFVWGEDWPAGDNGMIFSYDELRKYIKHMKAFGRVVSLGEWDGSNAIILRHDVDFDIEPAYRLSLVESECNVTSSFFIMTTCGHYNTLSLSNRKKIRTMAEMGFEIGLHFDPTVYGDVDEAQLGKYLDKEAEILSFAAGVPVKSISLHNPSVHGRYPIFDGYNNAYDKKIFSGNNYLSDSRMLFHDKNPYQFIERVKEHPVQVLLHPLHYSEEKSGYPQIFYEHIKRYVESIDNQFRVNSTYVSQLKHGDLLSFIISNGRDDS
jgi:hypothetical protein